MQDPTISAVILAAGKGTRMKSDKAKVLHDVYFKPMLHHVLDAVVALELDKIAVVTGHQAEEVEKSCTHYNVLFARQLEQLGTGHAVLAAESVVADPGGTIMILCGDTPLILSETLKSMLDVHMSGAHFLTVMTTVLEDSTNYGRILSDEDGCIEAIVEEKDASADQKNIKEVNAGIYCVNSDFLFNALKNVGTDNKQGEVYLTDIVSMAHIAGQKVHKFVCHAHGEILGVNSRVELSQAHTVLQSRNLNSRMAHGVSLVIPETLTVQEQAEIGSDTVLSPNVFICGETTIGKNCVIKPFTYIQDSKIGDNVTVGACSYLQGAVIGDNTTITPCSRIFDGNGTIHK